MCEIPYKTFQEGIFANSMTKMLTEEIDYKITCENK